MVSRILIILSLFSFCEQVYAKQNNKIINLEILMQDQPVYASPKMDEKPSAVVKLSKPKLKKKTKIQRSSAKTIDFAHRKVNKVNFSKRFAITRLDAKNIALGATGIKSIKQQPNVTVRSVSESTNNTKANMSNVNNTAQRSN